jgi:tetratricopeptide (TPR) repeat protein
LTYLRKNVHDRAIVDFNRAIKLKPDLAEAYANRGMAFAEAEYFKRAIVDFDRAIQLRREHALGGKKRRDELLNTIQLKPEDADLYYNRARAYHALGQFDRALADYTQALNIKSNHVTVYYMRGTAYRDKGDRLKAIFDFNKVLDLTNEPLWRRKAQEQLEALGIN